MEFLALMVLSLLTAAKSQTVPPVTSQTVPSGTSDTVPPVTSETVPPVTSATFSPVTSQTFSPVTSETVPPVTSHTVPPVTSQTVPPVTSQTVPPVTSHTVPPVTGSTVPAPGAPGGPCSLKQFCTDLHYTCINGKCMRLVKLGGKCSKYDICFDIALSLACDYSKCLLQAHQPCASNPDSCVIGAKCSNGSNSSSSSRLCECQPGYHSWQTDGELKCKKGQGKIGQHCSDNADCDDDPNLQCDADKNTCAIKATGACTSSDAQYCVTGSACHSNVCTCVPPNRYDKGACSSTHRMTVPGISLLLVLVLSRALH